MAPLTVTSQVVDWTCKRTSARPWLEHGLGDVVAVQGLGVGFLLAAVLSTARAEEQYEGSVANSVRLARCVGVVVDAGAGALLPRARITAVSMRCRTASDRASLDACLDLFPEVRFPPLDSARTLRTEKTHVSCIYDAGALTATLPYRSLEALMDLVEGEGVQVCHIGSNCIFHDARNHRAAEKLKQVWAERDDLSLPSAESLRLPLRSTADARVITCGNLNDTAMEAILSSRAQSRRASFSTAEDIDARTNCRGGGGEFAANAANAHSALDGGDSARPGRIQGSVCNGPGALSACRTPTRVDVGPACGQWRLGLPWS